MIPRKRCTQCGAEKPATGDYFTLARGRLRAICRQCQTRIARAHYDRTRRAPGAPPGRHRRWSS
jgi:hypothetical protein